MRKHLLLSLIISLCAMSAWADTSVTEAFSTAEQHTAAASATLNGDVCLWSSAYARHKLSTAVSNDDVITVGGNSEYGVWMSAEDDDKRGVIQTTNLEGGIKSVSFRWAQFGSEKDDVTLKLEVKVGETIDASADANNLERASDGENRTNGGILYSHNFNSKTNDQLSIKNISTGTVDGNKKRRIVVGYVTITPYLLYTTKKCTLDMRVASADPTRTFKNEDLIDNTGESPTYSILGEPSIDVQIDAESGTITVADRFQTGDLTIQAKWSEVTTTYTLHVLGKTNTSITCPAAEKRVGLTEDWSNPFTITPSIAPVVYASSNTSVATIDDEGTVTIVGVGQTTISATINEGENYGASSASYTLYVTDNSASVQVEGFSKVTAGNAAAHKGQLWQGDVCAWRVSSCGGVRKSTDVFASDQERVGIWMGTPDPNTNYSSLTAENGVEGGIKHIWFYVEQPYNTSETGYTLKPVIYLTEAVADNKVADVEVVGTAEPINIAANRKLLGASNVTKSNSVLIIRNESYKTDDKTRPTINPGRGRFLLDDIHITPWLLYTTKEATLDITDGTMTYKNTSLIDNTDGGNITYTSSDTDIAKVASDGTVTATGLKGGEVRITATWSDVGAGAYTYYDLTVIPKQYTNLETFDNITTTANYTTLTGDNSKQGDVAQWSTLLGGFNPDAGDAGRSVNDNCARFKARYSDKQTDPVPYIQSSTIPGGIKSLKFKCKAGGDESATTWIIKVYINNDEFTVPAESIPTNANLGWKSIEISDINVAGDFVIRFENQSTISEYISGNKGRLLIDDIEWEGLPMALEDEADNSTVIENNAGYKRNVMLADRTIRTGGYNTLCLPFAVSEGQLKATLGDGVKAYEFTNAYLSGSNLDIRFDKVEELEAGKPYLVTVTANVPNPVFESVTIDSATTNNITKSDNMWFRGSYNAGTMNGTGLYVVADSLYRVSKSANKTIGACRAYFDVPDDAPALGPVRMRIIAGTNTATDIEAIMSDGLQVTGAQKIIRDGQLFIIRDERIYNAQGQVVK